MKKTIIAIAATAMALTTGCGKKASAEGPQAWCEAIYARRAKVLRINTDAATKPAFLAECVTQPAEYLSCEATDWMARRDERCAGIVKSHGDIQTRLNAILMTGHAP